MDFPVTFLLVFSISILAILSTFFLSIRGQLFVLWAYLPFVDMLKRMVFLDPNASSVNMYAVLFTQDIFLLGILGKVLLSIFSNPVRIRFRAVDLAILLFALISAISALITPTVPLSGRIAAIGMRVWPMVTYFLAASYLNDSISLRRLSKLTLILGVVVAIYGINQFFFGMLPFEELWYERAYTSSNVAHMQFYLSRGIFRAFSTLDSHSSFGLFLGICIIFTWAWKRNLGALKWFLLTFVLSFGLILTFTRFTWLMPILAAGFIFVFNYSRIRPFISLGNLRKASFILLFVTGSFGIFYLAMSSIHGMRFVSATSNAYLRRALGTGTLEARLRVSNFFGGDMSISFLGNGLAASNYFARKFDFVSVDVNYHNIFVDMVDAMGVIGLVSFLLLLYLLFRSAIISIINQSEPQTRTLLVAIFGLLLALITVGHFNGAVFYFGRAIPVYFWSIAGILANFGRPSLFVSMNGNSLKEELRPRYPDVSGTTEV
jgi:hypothetical protein